MSVQGGVWDVNGAPADRSFLARMSEVASLHGPDGEAFHVDQSIGIFYRPLHTTDESLAEHQPYISAKGYAVTWDGRLDDRDELASRLSEELRERTDVAIVAAAYDKWGTECFSVLLGEWALAVWNPRDQMVILAKDYMGTRSLFYRSTPEQLTWCTVIDPLVRLINSLWQIDNDFIAEYLTCLPSDAATPFSGIKSVPAASYVTVDQGKAAAHRYWTFNPAKRVTYREDAEYEEHFRQVFNRAICRRLRSQAPVLAELSGGLDSSSIVCMADRIIADRRTAFPRLDTISYFDDEEPNWNEKPYFEKVEQQRGRAGCHVSAVPRAPLTVLTESNWCLLPGISQSSILFERDCAVAMRSQQNRVLLSGIGGDEVLGGVPTPFPELADLVVQVRVTSLISKVKQWGLTRKQPWFHLVAESLRMAIGHIFHADRVRGNKQEIPWLDARFAEARAKRGGGMSYDRPAGCLPSQAAFLRTIAQLRGQLAQTPPPLVAPRETRYPYLDRDLCEFLFSIPREQILRPGQRRSLMRRAMAGIVPSEILNRKRKAFVVRRYMTMYGEAWPDLRSHFSGSISQSLGYIDDTKLLSALTATIHGEQSHLVPLARTVAIELWLRSLDSVRLISHQKSGATTKAANGLSRDFRAG